jgi:hypothetical protein
VDKIELEDCIAFKAVECPVCDGKDIFCRTCRGEGYVLEKILFDEAANEWFKKQRPKQEEL